MQKLDIIREKTYQVSLIISVFNCCLDERRPSFLYGVVRADFLPIEGPVSLFPFRRSIYTSRSPQIEDLVAHFLVVSSDLKLRCNNTSLMERGLPTGVISTSFVGTGVMHASLSFGSSFSISSSTIAFKPSLSFSILVLYILIL